MKKKSNGDDKILKKDMSQTADRPGMVFMIHLLDGRKMRNARTAAKFWKLVNIKR
ncbi:hypothetical protein [Treponema denticola]|uniref:hypothetical protein n=1 Tax=Treponema denticola TaxID=158 RepID=UPI0002B571FD|nr:hypothetical protein [Treponema denticola]EMB22959.1 hypothetical protein HMPREF9724_01228 [Treponema denticola SP37]EPF35023.1 hypothetical protein HMPREF9734_00569 [Treponema denticola SP44]EPF38834.1 hypothetical protein HMPREF9731_02086 [Treponema denticola SP23]